MVTDGIGGGRVPAPNHPLAPTHNTDSGYTHVNFIGQLEVSRILSTTSLVTRKTSVFITILNCKAKYNKRLIYTDLNYVFPRHLVV